MNTKLLSNVGSISSNDRSEGSVYSNDNVDTSNKWRVIRITYAIMFFTSISYSIQMPSVWPYMNIIDTLYSKQLLGWVVASYSIGQLIACPLFSFFAGKTGYYKLTLLFSALLAAGGNYLYAIIVDVEGDLAKLISLITSRVIIGIAGANVAPIRLFLTVVTTEDERMGPMSILSACQGLGFIIGPGLQAAFVPIGYPGVLDVPFFRINMYTAPGLFSVLTNMIIFFLILFLFKDGFLKRKKSLPGDDSSITEYRNIEDDSLRKDPGNDYFSAIFMLLAFFICMMSLAVLETSCTPMTMDNFGWSKSKATLINSILLASSGFCSLLVYLALRFITKIIKEKVVLIIGFILIFISAIFLIPMGTNHIPIQFEDIIGNFSIPTTNNGTGCDSLVQPWCLYVNALEIWQYGASLLFFTFGYPTANVLSYVIFSRLINRSGQSLWMGLLTASGSLARVLGPVFISTLYDNWGTLVAFGSWSSILLLFLLSTPLFIWRMIKMDRRIAPKLPINQ